MALSRLLLELPDQVFPPVLDERQCLQMEILVHGLDRLFVAFVRVSKTQAKGKS